jgi:hypothetical protein
MAELDLHNFLTGKERSAVKRLFLVSVVTTAFTLFPILRGNASANVALV